MPPYSAGRGIAPAFAERGAEAIAVLTTPEPPRRARQDVDSGELPRGPRPGRAGRAGREARRARADRRRAGHGDRVAAPTGDDWWAKFDRIVGSVNKLNIRNDRVFVQELSVGTEYEVDTCSADGRHGLTAAWRYAEECPQLIEIGARLAGAEQQELTFLGVRESQITRMVRDRVDDDTSVGR